MTTVKSPLLAGFFIDKTVKKQCRGQAEGARYKR